MPELTTDRLILREFVEQDWESVLAYQSNDLYLRYYEWTHRTEADVREFVGWFLADQKEHPRTKFQLAIEHRACGKLIGNCGVRINDADLREGNIGFAVDPSYWGQGYATEAVRAATAWGDAHFGACQAACIIHPENLASIRVAEKCGYRKLRLASYKGQATMLFVR